LEIRDPAITVKIKYPLISLAALFFIYSIDFYIIEGWYFLNAETRKQVK